MKKETSINTEENTIYPPRLLSFLQGGLPLIAPNPAPSRIDEKEDERCF